MGLWRNILRVLGLSNDTRVQIRAPGIEITITGHPAQVRSVLSVVKQELERVARLREQKSRRKKMSDSQIVRPTELDEMDSPYALPEAVVMPVKDEEEETDADRLPASRSRKDPPFNKNAKTLQPTDEIASLAKEIDPSVTDAEVRAEIGTTDREPNASRRTSSSAVAPFGLRESNEHLALDRDLQDPEQTIADPDGGMSDSGWDEKLITTVAPDPSGASEMPQVAKQHSSFFTDSNPTLAPDRRLASRPGDSDSGTDPETEARTDSQVEDL